MNNNPEIKKLETKLKRREKTIEDLKHKLNGCRIDLRQIKLDIDSFNKEVQNARKAMELFLGLEDMEQRFKRTVEDNFHVVEKKSNWDW